MSVPDPRAQALPTCPVTVAIVGGGPAGLMAAEVLGQAGVAVHGFDAMPSVGRKFLLAGRGGLNLTHSEPFDAFVSRYGPRAGWVRPWLESLGPQALRDWAAGLGIATFVGSSGRVFPTDMKAAPLLRAWLQRLRHPPPPGAPAVWHVRHRCLGLRPTEGGWTLVMHGPQGVCEVQAQAVVLALGGGSWSRLGSDGAWVAWLRALGVPVAPLVPANCGFDVARSAAHPQGPGWSPHLVARFAGAPLKGVVLRWRDAQGRWQARKGECVLTSTGLEGSLVYAAAADLRDRLAAEGETRCELDLLPDRTADAVRAALQAPRGGATLARHLERRLGLQGARRALLWEVCDEATRASPEGLASHIKALPLTLARPRPLDEAISSGGGVPPEALDAGLMLRAHPGLFCAGEMLDWEAPTGGYLLTACFASGAWAARGLLAWWAKGQDQSLDAS